MLGTWYHRPFLHLNPNYRHSFVLYLCSIVSSIPSFVLNPIQSYHRFPLGDAGDVVKSKLEFWVQTGTILLCYVCTGLCDQFYILYSILSIIPWFPLDNAENMVKVKLEFRICPWTILFCFLCAGLCYRSHCMYSIPSTLLQLSLIHLNDAEDMLKHEIWLKKNYIIYIINFINIEYI